MLEKGTSIALAIITLAGIAVVATHPALVKNLGGTFVAALRTAATAGRT